MPTTDHIILLIIAILNAYVAWRTIRTDKNMALLEKNTNSIKDALVKSTGEAAHAAGVEQGRGEGEASAANRTKP